MNDSYDEETEEEHAVRLRKISEEVKADIKAGRYANGQVHPHTYGSYKFEGTVTGRLKPIHSFDDFSLMYPGILESKMKDEYVTLDSLYHHCLLPRMERSRRYDHVIMDECHHIKPETYWLGEYKSKPKEKDWERKTFKSGGPTSPSEAVRLKRRAERKAKKK